MFFTCTIVVQNLGEYTGVSVEEESGGRRKRELVASLRIASGDLPSRWAQFIRFNPKSFKVIFQRNTIHMDQSVEISRNQFKSFEVA